MCVHVYVYVYDVSAYMCVHVCVMYVYVRVYMCVSCVCITRMCCHDFHVQPSTLFRTNGEHSRSLLFRTNVKLFRTNGDRSLVFIPFPLYCLLPSLPPTTRLRRTRKNFS